MRRFKFTTFPE